MTLKIKDKNFFCSKSFLKQYYITRKLELQWVFMLTFCCVTQKDRKWIRTTIFFTPYPKEAGFSRYIRIGNERLLDSITKPCPGLN